MGQLNQVATGAHAAMFINTGNNIMIDQGGQQFHQAGVNAGMRLHQTVEPGHQHGFSQQGAHGVAHAGTMTANQVILKLEPVFVADLILGHGAETRVDAINQFSGGEMFQELKTGIHLIQGRRIQALFYPL